MVDMLTPQGADKASAFDLCIELYAQEWARMQLGLPSQAYEMPNNIPEELKRMNLPVKLTKKEKRVLSTLETTKNYSNNQSKIEIYSTI